MIQPNDVLVQKETDLSLEAASRLGKGSSGQSRGTRMKTEVVVVVTIGIATWALALRRWGASWQVIGVVQRPAQSTSLVRGRSPEGGWPHVRQTNMTCALVS